MYRLTCGTLRAEVVGYEKTPRQMGFHEDDLNFLEFDEKSGREVSVVVDISFDINGFQPQPDQCCF